MGKVREYEAKKEAGKDPKKDPKRDPKILYLRKSVIIVLGGTIFTRIHKNPERKNGAPGKILIKHVAGDVLGYPKIDDGATTNPDCWNICLGKVEVLKVRREDFAPLWDLHSNRVKKDRTYNSL